MSPPLFSLKRVTRSFRTGGVLSRATRTDAVKDVTFDINRGEVLGIVGESGCGKTTLMRMLIGLIPPTSGEVLLDGTPVARIPGKLLARLVQPVFQDPYSSLNPRHTVGQLISRPLVVHGVRTRGDHRRETDRLMSLVGLPSRIVTH